VDIEGIPEAIIRVFIPTKRVAVGIGNQCVGNLILEIGIKIGCAETQAHLVVPERAGFVAGALLRLQIWIADNDAAGTVRAVRTTSAASRIGIAGSNGTDFRSAETGRDAALEGQLLSSVPDCVTARAEMRSVDFMVIHAETAGKSEIRRDPPFILGEERPLANTEFFIQVGAASRI